MNETLIQLLQYGGLPALGIGIIYFLYRAILGLEIFPRLTRQQSFIIILTVILSTVLIILVLVLYGGGSETENSEAAKTEKHPETPKKKKIVYGGKVLNLDGKPLVGAKLSFRLNDSTTIHAMDPTDNYGHFHFEFKSWEESFKAQLRVEHEDYDDAYRRNVTIVNNKEDELIQVSIATSGQKQEGITYFKIYGLDDETRNKLEEEIIAIDDKFQTSPQGIKVEFRHSSGIKSINGTYGYLNGNVVIKVDGNTCKNLSSLTLDKYKINATGTSSFQKKLIVKSLQTNISKQVKTYNVSSLARSIVSCLE